MFSWKGKKLSFDAIKKGIKYTPDAPVISVNVATGELLVFGNDSLDLTYLLYINDVSVGSFTTKKINLGDFIAISDNFTIKVKTEENTYFGESEFSNIIDYDLILNGTPGLTYKGDYCTGWGTADTTTDITVASVVNGTVILVAGGFRSNKNAITITFPDSVTTFDGESFAYSPNKTIVFGANVKTFTGSAFVGANECVLDFRKAVTIPTIVSWSYIYTVKLIIVPDNLYDEWIAATNWSSIANKIIRASDYTDTGTTNPDHNTPLTITKNGTYEIPVGVRRNPVVVNVPIPTLYQPTIEFNANGGHLYIFDGENGNFSNGYDLYINSEKKNMLIGTNHLMQEIGATETDEIGIVAVSDLFNNSPMATARWNDLELGTIGLLYSSHYLTGIPDAVTESDIYVASIVNGIVITKVQAGAYLGSNRTIYLPNSLTEIEWNVARDSRNSNLTIVFGTDISIIGTQFLQNATGTKIYDLRKAKKLPTLAMGCSFTKAIVPDEIYETAIVATNWSAQASKIIKASIWEAQQGGSV